CQRLVGCRFGEVGRRAKYLLLALTTPSAEHRIMLCHLGMSGCLRLLAIDDEEPKHQHLLITLDSGMRLSYADPRRFGVVDLIEGSSWGEHPLLCRIAVEPLEPLFDADYLYQAVCRRRVAIKNLLLNSHVVAGVGNIYACEALFDAQISPYRPGSSLSLAEVERLVVAIISVLQRAIAAGGSTIRDFAGSDGRPGYFAHQFRCYGREGQPCFRCETPIMRSQQQGRSSFYCPSCQPE
ncbi:MAG: bifunctional DNA-formamidopyrimidine glycosylase/DNA-(apurinic or apyrimidinic site) lyase, partial [Mariprofundales bacterium]|nr:bifunctional DNA-formamidopyrimidine glycosylase/DNA-(apurinic or apyrimidinic site) lyase [Mariprofundales bacterium]